MWIVRQKYVYDARTSFDVTTRKNIGPYLPFVRRKREEKRAARIDEDKTIRLMIVQCQGLDFEFISYTDISVTVN